MEETKKERLSVVYNMLNRTCDSLYVPSFRHNKSAERLHKLHKYIGMLQREVALYGDD